jgi:16S rRNA (guanine527-N7)-methyltransferase
LPSIRVVHGRAEEIAREDAFRESFVVALARAVAPLRVLLELTLPLVVVGGFMAAPKGSGAEREIREASLALEKLGGEIVSSSRLDLPDGAVKPKLVLVRKVRSTPETYPRRTGIPNKRPL